MPDTETDSTTLAEWNIRKAAGSMTDADESFSPSSAKQTSSGRFSYKLFEADESGDEFAKTSRQQIIDKLLIDDDADHKALLTTINETISSNRELSLLYSRVERDPFLFASTFLNGNINSMLDINTGSSNSLVFSVLNLIRNENIMRRALEPALNSELNGIRTQVELLRNNSPTTRLLTLCAKALGQSVITGAVQPVIRRILDSNVAFEIDPVIEENENVRKSNLKALCDSAADILKRVIADIPLALVSVCRITYAAIEAKFPSHGWIGISNILFLRFICSSILVPSSGSEFSKQQKRNLIVLTKLIQSAASLRKFDAKETYMQATNKFLTKVIPQLTEFYDSFAASNESDDDILPESLRSYLVVRKISSLTRIAEYLDSLGNHPAALSATCNSLSSRIAYHHGFRHIILSVLHDCIFIYEDRKQNAEKSVSMPLERYPIEKIELPIAISNGVLILKVPEVVRLQFTDDEECIKWKNHLETHIQKCKS